MRPKPNYLYTPRTLPVLPSRALALTLDDFGRLADRCCRTGLGVSFAGLHKLRCQPTISELVLQALSVLFVLKRVVILAARLGNRVAYFLWHVVGELEPPVRQRHA